jgi:DNA-binding beta-propeller fold protein YncE
MSRLFHHEFQALEITVNRSKAMIWISAIFAFVTGARAQEKVPPPLKLTQTFELPTVKGHFDHFAVDAKRNRMFAAAVDSNALLVVDLATGKLIQTIPMPVPRAVVYREDLDRFYVSEGGEGALRIYDGKTYKLLKSVKLLVDADPVVYDPTTKYIYVVNGGEKAGQPYSVISVIDTTSGSKLADIKVTGIELEAMAIEDSGPRLFVNNRDKNQVDVIDREKRMVIASWPVTMAKGNTSLALDDATHRLFVASRSGHIVVFNTETGKELQALPIGQGVDDMAFDPASKRIYVSCGGDGGSVDVYKEQDADHYQSLGKVPSAPGASTARLVSELGRYFVLSPAQKTKPAAILVYQVQ